MNDFWPSLASTCAALALVLGLAWMALRTWHHLARRQGQRGPSSDRPRIVQGLPLGPRERVVVLEYRGNTYLLGLTAAGLCVIDAWRAAGTTAPQADEPTRQRHKHEMGAASSREASHRER